MTHENTAICPRCGKPNRRQIPGQCAQCLMALAMNDDVNVATAGPRTGQSGDFHVPPIEELVSQFSDLEIQHLIGHGGMGAVYQARQINLDRVVALKILSPRLSNDPAFAERFLREARTLAKLSHPNIVTVFDFGKAGEFYYLTMEFVDGVNLRDTIASKLLSPTEALAIVPQVCEALQYAHDHGVVHRDIKPENILIAKSGGIKIADFGLAKLLSPTSDQYSLTGTRQVLGTVNYMAPEQIESPNHVDHRADLYSLGVVFYELLTGELPLGRFSLPSEKSASVSNRLDDVVMRTLEKDPDRRFQQASQIKTACESIDEPPAAKSDFAPDFHEQPFDDSNATAICVPFPITIQDIFAGMASGFGLMRGYDTHLQIEYEIRDSVVEHKWGAGKIQLPLKSVASIRLHQGWFLTHLEIQADNMDVVSQIPNSKHGAFRVYLKKKDREPAQQLVWRVNELIGKSVPMPPVKSDRYKNELVSSKSSGGMTQAIFLFLILGFGAIAAGVVILLFVLFANSPTEIKLDQEGATAVTEATVSETPKVELDAHGEEGVFAGASAEASVRGETAVEIKSEQSDLEPDPE